MSDQNQQHRFAVEQLVEPQSDNYPPRVEIVGLLPGRCAAHRAPYYACVHSDDHFTFCEALLKPTNRSKLN